MTKLIRFLALAIDAIAAVMAIAAIALVCFEAVVRYFAPQYAVDWGVEVIVFLLVWATFLMAARSAFENRHVAATVLVDLMPPILRSVLFLFSLLVGLGFGLVLLRYGWDVVEFSDRLRLTSDSSLRFPLAWYYAILPLAGALLCAGYLLRLWLFARNRRDRLPPARTPMDGQDP